MHAASCFARLTSITPGGYGDAMTEHTPEPTLADVMSAIVSLTEAQHASEQRITRRMDQLEDRMIDRFAKVREDSAGIKTQLAFEERFNRDTAEAIRRHLEDPDAHHRHVA
jgi:hypothetical protein